MIDASPRAVGGGDALAARGASHYRPGPLAVARGLGGFRGDVVLPALERVAQRVTDPADRIGRLGSAAA
jgi:hypothetical protein